MADAIRTRLQAPIQIPLITVIACFIILLTFILPGPPPPPPPPLLLYLPFLSVNKRKWSSFNWMRCSWLRARCQLVWARVELAVFLKFEKFTFQSFNFHLLLYNIQLQAEKLLSTLQSVFLNTIEKFLNNFLDEFSTFFQKCGQFAYVHVGNK